MITEKAKAILLQIGRVVWLTVKWIFVFFLVYTVWVAFRR